MYSYCKYLWDIFIYSFKKLIISKHENTFFFSKKLFCVLLFTHNEAIHWYLLVSYIKYFGKFVVADDTEFEPGSSLMLTTEIFQQQINNNQ